MRLLILWPLQAMWDRITRATCRDHVPSLYQDPIKCVRCKTPLGRL